MKYSCGYVIILFFLVLYLVFPSGNSSVDAFYYAASVRHSGELFHPHHLLYNATAYVILELVSITGLSPDVLSFMQVLNALAAVLCLFILSRILERIGRHPTEICGHLMLAGASFVFWRYATENEAYIFPLTLSLLASLAFLRFTMEGRNRFMVLSGGYAAMAILFHQIHLFWWLGLLAGTILYFRRLKPLIFFSLPALLIPAAYLSVFLFLHQGIDDSGGFIHFIFRDLYSEGVDTSPGWENVYLTGINLVRCFIQVHGLMLVMVRKSLLYLLPAFLSLVFLILVFTRKGWIRKRQEMPGKAFWITHLCILFLQLSFAFFSVGNAEFMVMIPVLVLLLFTSYFEVNRQSLAFAGIALLIWNFGYGVLPQNRVRPDNHNRIMEWVTTHPDDLFILDSDQHILSKLYYVTGNEAYGNVQKGPENLVFRNQSLSALEQRMEKTWGAGYRVYTDCITYPKVLSRAEFLSEGVNEEFFKRYISLPVDSVSTFQGTWFIHEIFTPGR